jgi:signal transduction histidine kinase
MRSEGDTFEGAFILVIDDNEAARFVRAQTLRRAGFRTIEASTGDEGLAIASRENIDLIVCDINLPDMNGLEVARRAKSSAQHAMLQVLHVSQTETSDAAVARGLDTTSDAYLVEPVGPQVLIATVRSLLRLRHAEQQLVGAIARETEARHQAEEANRTKDDFLAMLSHELRTPLNTIMGWLWQLRQAPLEPAVLNRAIDALDRAARLQTQIIRDLTDVSRIQRGKIEVEMTRVDVAAVVGPAVEELRRRAEPRRIEVLLRALPVTVLADTSRLEQIVTNIGNNALQFTPDGGRITVEVRPDSGMAMLRISDTGRGIESEFLPHVFERFRQAESGTRRHHSGLGLGLAIVQHLVELHRGTVRIESEGLGRGTTVTVRLPSLEGAPAPVRAHEPRASLAGYRVLVVEDEPEPRELLTRALEGAGAQVMSSFSAIDAIALAHSHAFDLILSDIGLPGLDGIEMLARLRAAGIQAPAIAITAFATAPEQARVLEAGFATFVAKPASPTAVIAAAARLLGEE